jgi:hypothetical protein
MQEEVLAETVAMIPDGKKRLENAAKDLKNFVVCICGEGSLIDFSCSYKMNQAGWTALLPFQCLKRRAE